MEILSERLGFTIEADMYVVEVRAMMRKQGCPLQVEGDPTLHVPLTKPTSHQRSPRRRFHVACSEKRWTPPTDGAGWRSTTNLGVRTCVML
jgi:hypothetical protein